MQQSTVCVELPDIESATPLTQELFGGFPAELVKREDEYALQRPQPGALRPY
jgi:hypothetical protein